MSETERREGAARLAGPVAGLGPKRKWERAGAGEEREWAFGPKD